MKKILIGSSLAAVLLIMITVAVTASQNTQIESVTNTRTTTPVSLDTSSNAVSTNADYETTVSVNETTTITDGGEHIISGTIDNGQIIVDTGDDDVTLVLNGVDITFSNGAPIYIKSAGDVTIELAEGSSNTLTQTGTDTAEEEKAALYSTSDLEFTGSGTLYVISTVADGISSSDDIVIGSGTITIDAADDGIRGKDSLTVNGGTITIDATGDGIKSTNTEEIGRGTVTINGGMLTVTSGDDAIKAEQEIYISGGTISIPTSGEGIEAPVITIDDGDITIYATDDGINAAASDIITTGLLITINGGNLTIEVGPGDTDAIDSNGAIVVNGGTIDITAQMSSFDYDTTGSLNGGTVTVNGSVITEMPAHMMGGPGGGRGMRGTPPAI